MSRVKNANTKPEILVRKLLHKLGYRFRLHNRELPGSPDVVLPRHRKVVFVHGCFWHGHTCPRGKRPTSREDFWNTKLDKNLARDAKAQQELAEAGWNVLVVWECQTKDQTALSELLNTFLNNSPHNANTGLKA